jgi:uncharacterized SAM-binding protein YcdF (DUF218 family)
MFEGEASVSFTFMTASAFIMLLTSALILTLAARNGALLERMRGSRAWRRIRAALSLFALFIICVESMIIFASYPGKIPETAEIIILGAHVSRTGLSQTLQSRLDAGAEYAKANPGALIIVSGGQGLDEPVSEAEAMRDYLALQGIDEDRIIMESRSHNTFENFIFSGELLQMGEKPYPIAVVTSEFHILRASMLAARAGFKPYFIAAKTPAGILPSCYSREFFGLIKSFITDR